MAESEFNTSRASQTRRETDGTREYLLHSHRTENTMDGAPAGIGALNAGVYRGLREHGFFPGLALSGEQPRHTLEGLAYPENVVREEMKQREEYPYG